MLRSRVQNIISPVLPLLALLLLKLLKFKGKKSHIHHDPDPNGPMGRGMANLLSTIKSQQPRHRSALIPLNKAIAVDDTKNQWPRSSSFAPHTFLINKNQNLSNESQPSIALTKSTSKIVLLSLPKFQFESPGINSLPLLPNPIANSKKEEWGSQKHKRKN